MWHVFVLQERSATQMTTLEDLYYGNIIPVDQSFKQGSVYSEVLGYSIRHQEDLRTTLNEQQKEIFEKLKDCESELHSMNERQAFTEGFKLVAKLLTKVMQDMD